MRKLAAVLIALVLATAVPLVAWAQTEAGMSELGVSISSHRFQSDDTSGEVNTTIINIFYGYFFTDAIEIAANISVTDNDIGNVEYTQTSLELQGKYHFTGISDIFLPYLGVQAGVYGFDDGAEELLGNSGGFLGGAKYFLSEKTSMNLEYNFRIMELEDDDDKTYDATVTVLGIGYSVYF